MLETELLDHIRANPFLLAPMAGITDCGFRSFMRDMGCGVVTTELVSASGLRYSSEKTRRIMRFDKKQSPVGIQIFGEDLQALAEAAQECEQMGADFVDLNFGCPVPKVVKKGAGSAVLKDLVQLGKVLSTVRRALSIPLTIKIRTGWNSEMRNSPEVIKVAYEEGITWVAIHGRTRAQAYTGKADWDYIQAVKSKSPIPIIGNGDITSAQIANARLSESGCDAVMIGRGCLKNPWIFEQAMSTRHQETVSKPKDFLRVFELLSSNLEKHCEERVFFLHLKKLSAWYSSGYKGSAQFRRDIFKSKEHAEILSRIQDFFAQLNEAQQSDTSDEPFLMGGHG